MKNLVEHKDTAFKKFNESDIPQSEECNELKPLFSGSSCSQHLLLFLTMP